MFYAPINFSLLQVCHQKWIYRGHTLIKLCVSNGDRRSFCTYAQVNIKGKISPCWIKHHNSKAYDGEEVYQHQFETRHMTEVKWSASRPGPFIPEDEPHVIFK